MSWLNDLFSGDAKPLNKIKAQDFGENDSQIVSALRNPKKSGEILADWLKSHTDDYKQLYSAYPNANKFGAMLKDNISKNIPSNADFQSPKSMGEWSLAAALNAPMAGTFIGPKAVNWNKKAAATATQLLDNGVDPAQVWKEHLIGRMPDKSLFSEIDDSVSSLNLMNIPESGDNFTTIGKSINHPRLNNSYDFIKDFPVDYHQGNHQFNHGSLNGGSNGFISVYGQNDSAKSTVLHELQHAIQDREGWAQGGNPETFKNEYVANRARLNFLENEPDIKKVNDEYSRNTNAILDDATDYKDAELKIKDLEEELMRNYPGFAEQQKVLRQLKGSDSTGIKPYRRLTGEAQARATQDRMNLNMQQRRDSYPLAKGLLADIKLKDLINRYGNNGQSMSVNKLPETQFSKAHDIAQKNAALPVEQGGLGLPANNTVIDRAKAMGFDTNAYHGSNEELINIGKGLEGGGLYTTNNPRVADDFAMWRRTYNGANVSPLMLKKGKSLEIDANYNHIRGVEKNTNIKGMKYGETVDDYANRKRYDSIEFKNVRDDVPSSPNIAPISDVIRNIKGRNVRSRFAAFDPMKRNSANILASMLLGSVALDKFKEK